MLCEKINFVLSLNFYVKNVEMTNEYHTFTEGTKETNKFADLFIYSIKKNSYSEKKLEDSENLTPTFSLSSTYFQGMKNMFGLFFNKHPCPSNHVKNNLKNVQKHECEYCNLDFAKWKWKYWSSHPGCILQKTNNWKSCKIHMKTPMPESLFLLKLQTEISNFVFLKKRLWHGCFPVNFAKFLRATFL